MLCTAPLVPVTHEFAGASSNARAVAKPVVAEAPRPAIDDDTPRAAEAPPATASMTTAATRPLETCSTGRIPADRRHAANPRKVGSAAARGPGRSGRSAAQRRV